MDKTITFNLNDPVSVLLKQARNNLAEMKSTTHQPLLLDWQLRFYDFVLSQPDPNKAAEAYFRAKNQPGGVRDGLIRAARMLGFKEEIPAVER